MSTRSTLAAVPLLAAGALLGCATVGTVGQEKKPEPGERAAAALTPV